MPRQKKTDTEKTKKTTRVAATKKTTAKAAKKTTKKTAAKDTSATRKTTNPKPRKKSKASDWKDEIKLMLEQMKKELLQDVGKSIKDESDYLKNDVGDFYDHASNDRDRELALMFTDRERTKLIQIDESLKRIEEGVYGECDNCMDEIGEDRLRVMPFAKLCLSCKIELERHGEL
ncbi:MAG: hypothetical protein GWN11_08665 [Candidatus Dadabacteria bacterium]|nr:hypothetical protein [Candidatus Dadabacteria bacterium]